LLKRSDWPKAPTLTPRPSSSDLILAVSGLGIGVFVSLLLTQFMAGMLYGVRPFDPVTFVSVSAVLLLVSLVASTVPAYRAARLDPMQTLREQ